jgi:hypothetical protein
MPADAYNREHRGYRKLYNAAYGPLDTEYAEPDWEAMEVHDRALQGLSRTLREEES